MAGKYGCTGRAHGGGPCNARPVKGTDRCKRCAGIPLHKQRAKGQVVLELRAWGLTGDDLVDPGETLLRLVTQSSRRVELYSSLLEQAYDAAERLRALDDTTEVDGALPPHEDNPTDRERAFHDLARVFSTGGVAALIGIKWAAAGKDGNLYQAEEGIRGLVALEAAERERCATFAAKAVAAGLAERQVRLAEQQGAIVADAIRAMLTDLGHDVTDPAVQHVVSTRLLAIAGGAA